MSQGQAILVIAVRTMVVAGGEVVPPPPVGHLRGRSPIASVCSSARAS